MRRRFDGAVLAIVLLIYFVNRIIKVYGDYLVFDDFFRYHFNDLCAGIAFIAYINLVLSFSKYNRITKIWQILLFALLCSFWWEVITPIYKNDSTPDILDALSYFIGTVLYWALDRYTNRKISVKK